jgi:4-hydroxy-tetrahydrodipicolinate synthase
VECQKKINLLMGIYDVSQPFISAIKTAVSLLVPGLCPNPRQPFVGCNALQTDAVRDVLHSVGLTC